LIGEEELHEILSQSVLPEACRKLVAIARERGGPDNITLQILQIDQA
jgi:serine/threonine protein phosphatase PrpC